MKMWSDQLVDEISVENMFQTLHVFKTLHRYSGTEHGEQAAKYLLDKLAEYGVLTQPQTYQLYRSLPSGGSLEVQAADGVHTYEVMPAVFSGNLVKEPLQLVYVDVEKEDLSEALRACSGKAILIDHGADGLLDLASQLGVRAIIRIWKEDAIHHATIGTNWGTPGMRDAERYYSLGYAEIPLENGKALKKLLLDAPEGLAAVLSCGVDRKVVTSTMPVAYVPGKTDSFILVSGHYDSWYEGITDNGAANAIMLEMARIMQQHHAELERGILFAWWSGHSDARYAGSTWFCDNHWQQLKEHCVAHINIDIAGCKGSDMIVPRSTMTEGKEFCRSLIHEFTGEDPITYFPMYHAADQSFWGTDVPIHIMYCYEDKDRFVNDMCAMPSYAWWHTPADGIDKADEHVVWRDCAINLKTTAELAQPKPLSINYQDFFDETKSWLDQIDAMLPDELKLTDVQNAFRLLQETVESQSAQLQSDRAAKQIAGRLNQIVYAYCAAYEHDDAVESFVFPRLYDAAEALRKSDCAKKSLCARTDVIRQKNRLLGALQELQFTLDHKLYEL